MAAKSYVEVEASETEVQSMLNILEQVGKVLQPLDLATCMTGLSSNVTGDRERIIRFLLMVALLDQQAESPTARLTARRIYDKFGDDLFFSPQAVLVRMHTLVSLKGDYKISPAIGRVLPRFGWMVLRVGAFLIYEMMINKKKLSDELGKLATPGDAVSFLQSNAVLEAVLREKATSMFISWVGHPDLGIDVSKGRWRVSDFQMPVDGHVGKVFSRTGMLSEIVHEGKPGSSGRWNIIQASNMRPLIQAVVNEYGNDCIMVDHGAFRIGWNCCPDNLQGMTCDSCPKLGCEIASLINCKGRCLLADYCKRNLTWRAY